ncbi:MAG: peptidoglycan editing factor PgeF [Burkholderiaceae bacterium]|jgi:YfiH family protein
MHPDWIVPDWPVGARVGALLTSRNGGFSAGPFAGSDGGGLNLRFDPADDPAAVVANRALLDSFLPAKPVWLQQVHGTTVIDAGRWTAEGSTAVADAAYTTERGVVCAVQTADCMAVLFCDRQGTAVAVAHAGWRGLAAGVLENTVSAMPVPPQDLLAYLGPAIGPCAFEVGQDVLDAFEKTAGGAAQDDSMPAFVEHKPGKWLANLEVLARRRLTSVGIGAIYGGGRCTVSEPDHFYSFRRDHLTGRMAALIWLI